MISPSDVASQQPTSANSQKAAVLLPIFLSAADQPAELILIQRAKTLSYHPGQLAFPGGKHENSDRDLAHTALRESEEEIGLSADYVTLINQLPEYETVSGFCLTPFVGIIKHGNTQILRRDPKEVDSILAISLPFLFEHAVFEQQFLHDRHYAQLTLQGRIINKRIDVIDNWHCWGATATILYQWVQNTRWTDLSSFLRP